MNSQISDDIRRQIQLCAYHIWEREGRPEGREHAHWRMAEAEILGAKPKKAAAAKTNGSTKAAKPKANGAVKAAPADKPAATAKTSAAKAAAKPKKAAKPKPAKA